MDNPVQNGKKVIAMTTYFSSKLPIQEQTLKVFTFGSTSAKTSFWGQPTQRMHVTKLVV